MRWEKAFATGVRRLAKEKEEELPDHPDYLPTSLIAPRVGHMLRALANGDVLTTSTVGNLAHAILKNGDHHSLPILADALEEADTGEDNDPFRWINWRNAGHGIELDKRVLQTLMDRHNGPIAPRFSNLAQQAAHNARFNRPIFDVVDGLSKIHPNDITPEMRREVFPAVSDSLARIGQHSNDTSAWRMMDDDSWDDHKKSLRESLLKHGDLAIDHWSTIPPENQLAGLKSAVRYEEPADIKFPGE